MRTKKQIFFDTLELKNEIVLGSIWHHFLPEQDQIYGYRDDATINQVITAQKQFFKQNNPDFVKIMSDAFLIHPSILETDINQVEDFNNIKPLGKDHPWITKQVKAVKEIVASYQNSIAAIYNIFSPAYYFRLKFDVVDQDKNKFPKLVEKNPEIVAKALDVIHQDLTILIEQLFVDAKIDGIYLCVQSVQSTQFSEENYHKYIEPSQLALLGTANHHSPYNILHICGFEGRTNHLTHFSHYPVKAVNWASYVEKIKLDEGKPIFENKAILGGFDNTINGDLYQGNLAKIEEITRSIVTKTGKKGLLLGADCSVPADIDFKNIQYALKIANTITHE